MEASSSGNVFCAVVASVSMSEFLRGEKNLRVNTAFGGSLTAVDVGTGLAYFLAVNKGYASCASYCL
jgi:hypothetical protein